MIVGLSGYAQSGKDTAAALLGKHGFRRVAFADPLKAIAFDSAPLILTSVEGEPRSVETLPVIIRSIGWDEAKEIYPHVRITLQYLGMAARVHLGPDVWVDATMRGIGDNEDVAVADVRFPNEAEAIKARGGVIVRINRPGVVAVNSHISETALDGYVFDAVVENDGTFDQFDSRLMQVINSLRRQGAVA